MFDYQKKVTIWEDPGTEPPEGLRKWQAGEKPPAAWWNWFWDAVQRCFTDIKNWINGHQDANTGVHGIGTGHVETVEGAQNKVNNAISTHLAASDPHPVYARNTDLASHNQANTGVHGIGTGHVETVEGAQTKVNSAISSHLAASDPHSQYTSKTTVNQLFSNDPATGHNHSGSGKGAPIPGSAITGVVAQAASAATCTGNAATAANVTTSINGQAITNIFESDGITAKKATIAAENRGSISASENTGSVTTVHSRQVNVSSNSTVNGSYSQVNASSISTASGSVNQINASYTSTVSASYSQINACSNSTTSGYGLYSQINASSNSVTDASNTQINASFGVINNRSCSTAGGYGSSGISSANRKWHIFSNPGSGPTIQIATTLQSNFSFTDYGEYFESLDGQEIPAGYIVTLEGKKIRTANHADQRYLGVISKTAGIILGGAGFCWQRRFLQDEFGGLITQTIPDPNWEPKEGQTEEDRPLIIVEVENPDYDPEREYQDRQSRPEWHIVGLLGQIHIRIDNTVQAKDYIRSNENGIGTKDETGRGWYVMDITTLYHEEKGYGVALCLVN
jgi:hypothetical protein